MAPSQLSTSGVRKRRVPSPGIKAAHLPRETTISDQTFKEGQHAHEDHTGAAPSQGNEASTHSARSSLVYLPSELIGLIASHLRNTKSVFSFGFVNKRLHGIVQQTIARDFVLGRGSIKGFLEMLGSHPELMPKVTSANLGDFACSRHQECICLGTPTLDADVLGVICQTMATNSGNGLNWTNIRDARRQKGPVWQINQAFFLDVLAALCPNIRSMEIQLPEAKPCHMGQPPRPFHMAPQVFPSLNPELLPVTPFQGPALHILSRTLHTLTIAEDTTWKGPATLEILHARDLQWRNMGKHIITLAGFTSLKRLHVPMEVLGRSENVIFSDQSHHAIQDGSATYHKTGAVTEKRPKTLEELRAKVLPLTLTHMHLRSCNKWTFSLLRKVNEIPTEVLQLRHIELFFKIEPQQAIMQCDAEDEGHFNYLQLLMELERKHVNVRFYFGAKETCIDMRRELAALHLLTPFEIWHFSAFYRPFSDLDPTASKKRRLSLGGSRLFVRYSMSHFQLLNSSTFNPTSWAEVAFFQGRKGIKEKHSNHGLRQRSEVGSGKDRPLGRRNFRRRLPLLLDVDHFKFSFRFEKRSLLLPDKAALLDLVFRVPSTEDTPLEDDMIICEMPPDVQQDYESSQPLKTLDRIAGQLSKANHVQGLENDMVELEIGPVPSVTASEDVACHHYAFDTASWTTTVDWGEVLSTEKMQYSVFG